MKKFIFECESRGAPLFVFQIILQAGDVKSAAAMAAQIGQTFGLLLTGPIAGKYRRDPRP